MTTTTVISKKDEPEEIGNRVVDLVASEVAHYSPSFVFGVTGDKVDPQIDAFVRQGTRFILAHDEGSSAFMASVVARLTGKLGVCMGMGAPGAVKLIPGLIQAATDRVPVLAISGTVESYNIGTDYTQEANLLDLFKGATVFNQMIITPRNAALLARIACRTAFAKNGVSHLCIPVDIATAVGERGVSEDGETNRILAPPCPRPELLEQAAKLLNDSENVVIFAGRGAENCAELVSKLSQKLQAPTFTTYTSKSVLPHADPHNLGIVWWSSSLCRKVVLNASAVLLIGTDYPYIQHLFSKPTKIVQIDSNPYSLGKRMCTVPVLGDAGESLSGLIPLVKQKENSSFLRTAQETMNELQLKADQERSDTTRKPMNPYYLIKTLEDALPENSVITLDGGSVGMYFACGFNVRRHTLIQGGRYASLGFSLPAAIAAKLVYPEREVVAATGDFGMMYCVNEIMTAVQNKLPVKIVVFNNRTQLTVKQNSMTKHYILPADPGEMDFAKVAEGCGASGRRVDDPRELKRAVEEFLSIKGVALLDVRTSQEISSVQYRTISHV